MLDDVAWSEAHPEIQRSFEPLARISLGDAANVFKARRIADGQIGALKFLTSGAFAHAASRTRLARQVDTMRAVERRSSVPVRLLDAVVGGPAPWLFLELLEGSTVDVSAPSPPRRVLDVGLALCDALSALHVDGHIFRAVEPSHVMLTPRGVRLVGFGNASSEEARVTGKGIRVGSIAYSAREQLKGERPTPAWDVYGLGALLVAMLTGTEPWKGKHIADVLTAPSSVTPFPEQALTGAPPYAAELLGAAIATDPTKRPDLGAFAAGLHRWAESL